MPKPNPAAPRTWLISGDFLTGELDPTAPAHVVAARTVASNVEAALNAGNRSRLEVAASAGISRSTLYALLSGQVFPDFVSVAKLCETLATDLWPRR